MMARIAAAIAAITVSMTAIASGALHWERAPFPYVWRDVAVVHLLAGLPLAWLLAVSSRRWQKTAGSFGLAALALAAGIALMLTAAGHPAGSLLLRIVVALAIMLAIVLTSIVMFGRKQTEPDQSFTPNMVAGAITALAILLFVPALYVAARQRDDAIRLQGLLQQSRLGESLVLADAMLALDPRTQFQDQRLESVRASLAQAVNQLSSRIAEPLSSAATDPQRLDRARDLAILGRTDEAIGVLNLWAEASAPPQALTLRGTIHEAREEWSAGREWYQRARRAWQAAQPSPEGDAQLIQATQGVAYCERKLGRYAEAEAAYRQLLALSPTADTHFLLAQFYEDVQHTRLAAEHARRAMALAPERYQAPGEQLLDKLVTLHFGCWGL